MDTIRNYIRLVISEIDRSRRAPPEKKLRVFDFDDTLVKTGSMIHVTSGNGDTFDLTPGEYAVYAPQPGDQFDYSDFEGLVDPREIGWTVKILRSIIAKGGEVVILTARGNPDPVRLFLQQAGLPEIDIIALGNSDPQRKADYISGRIEADGLQHVEFFDDSYKNIEAVKRLKPMFPGVDIIARHITH